MRKLRKVVLVAGVAAMTLSLAVPANALSNKNKLKFYTAQVGTGTASAGWQSGSDSPADGPNSKRIKLTVNSIDEFNYGYALAFNNNTGIQGIAIGSVRNLSFDFMNASPGTGYEGAGAPRISVDIDTGGSPAAEASAFLPASYCDTPYASPNDDWSRADFTGQTAVGCTLLFQNVLYSSDGVNSAWAVFVAAHPSYIVRAAYVVMDETGTAYLDRLAFQNKMFVATSKTTTCPTEVSC